MILLKIIVHTQKNINHIFLVVLLTKLFVLIINSVKEVVLYRGKTAVYKFANSCWICDKLFDVGDDKVRDDGHITGKYRGASHWSCNINLKISKKIPVIFHNSRGYDRHLTIKEVSKFDIKVSVILNGLEKYMASTINRNLVFIDSMQFMNSSLDSLVKNLSDHDFVCLSEEFSSKFLKLVKQKNVYLYEYMDSF